MGGYGPSRSLCGWLWTLEESMWEHWEQFLSKSYQKRLIHGVTYLQKVIVFNILPIFSGLVWPGWPKRVWIWSH